MDKAPKSSIEAPSGHGPLGLLSPAAPRQVAVDEPTQHLPTVGPMKPPPPWPPIPGPPERDQPEDGATGGGTNGPWPPPNPPRPEAPRVEARAVIIYERRSLGLLVLAALLVALTTGVVLGQTVAAKEPATRSAAAQAEPTPAITDSPPPAANPSPSGPLPATGQRVTAPLGTARGKARTFEVAGATTHVTVRSAALGDRLFDVAAWDGSVVPKVASRRASSRLEFAPTGTQGQIGGDIRLNAKVKWTLRVTGGGVEQEIDMRAGGLTGLDLAGGAAHSVLRLPAPKGTVEVTVSGLVADLTVQAGAGVPVRLSLKEGAGSAVVDGTARTAVKPGSTLKSAGWSKATNRYDIVTSKVRPDTIRVEHT